MMVLLLIAAMLMKASLMLPQPVVADQADQAAELEKKLDSLNSQMTVLEAEMAKFEKRCLNKDGHLLPKASKSCLDEKSRLAKALEQLTAEMDKTGAMAAVLKESAAQASCSQPTPNVMNGASTSTDDIDEAVRRILEGHPACSEQQRIEISNQCVRDVACNVARSGIAIAGLTGPLHILSLKLDEKTKAKLFLNSSCLASKKIQSNCLTEFAHGVLKDLFSNIHGLVVELPKMAWSGAKWLNKKREEAQAWAGKKIVRGWNWMWNIEDKTSEKLIATSSQDDQSIALWLQDKLEFAQNLSVALMNAIWDGAKSTFGCGLWEGVPYYSKCLQPMETWECSNCSQRMQSICGIVGYLGGEIVTGYFTGGGAAVGKVIAEGAVKAGAVIAAKLGKAFPKAAAVVRSGAALIPRIGQIAMTPVRLSERAVFATYKALTESRVAKAILKKVDGVAATTKLILLNSESLVAVLHNAGILAKDAIKILKASGTIIVYPGAAYLDLVNEGFLLGYKHANQMLTLARKKGVNVVVAGYMAGHVALKTGDAIVIPGQAFKSTMVPVELHLDNYIIRAHTTPDGKAFVVDSIIPKAGS